MTVKITIIVDNPNDPDAFEALYNSPANKEGLGKIGMDLLVGQEGAQVSVKCDKDVKVLKITVMAKK